MPKHAAPLTKRRLDALRRRAEGDTDYEAIAADGAQSGLAAWVRRGRVRFVFRYRVPGAPTRRRMQLADYGAITLEQARAVAQELRGKVAAGVDPQDERAEAARQAVTVAEAVAAYLADFRERAASGAQRGKRSGYASARRRLERHVLPALGRLRLRDVTPEQVRRMHRAMAATPVEANRTLTALSAVYGWADRAELLPGGANPVRYVERYAETGSRRALTADELAALGRALTEAAAEGKVTLPETTKASSRPQPPALS